MKKNIHSHSILFLDLAHHFFSSPSTFSTVITGSLLQYVLCGIVDASVMVEYDETQEKSEIVEKRIT
jgi:hypothetical protein